MLSRILAAMTVLSVATAAWALSYGTTRTSSPTAQSTREPASDDAAPHVTPPRVERGQPGPRSDTPTPQRPITPEESAPTGDTTPVVVDETRDRFRAGSPSSPWSRENTTSFARGIGAHASAKGWTADEIECRGTACRALLTAPSGTEMTSMEVISFLGALAGSCEVAIQRVSADVENAREAFVFCTPEQRLETAVP